MFQIYLNNIRKGFYPTLLKKNNHNFIYKKYSNLTFINKEFNNFLKERIWLLKKIKILSKKKIIFLSFH